MLPIGFGTILVNLPLSGAVTQVLDGVKEIGIIDVLFNAGISNELFPLLLFIGIGAMIDFTPLMTNPKMLFFGAAAQFGIFFTFSLASLFGFDIKDAASIAIMGAADGPTSIFVANYFNSKYIGAIVVAAYSYMALVPIIQPFVIKRIVAGLVAPRSVALIGFLMFGNLIRECGVLNSLSESAQKELANLITILLGITISTKMQAEYFLTKETIMILLLGLVAFIFDTVGGVLFAKILNLFLKNKINPMVGAAGLSAFPMSARVIHKMGLKEDPNNFLLMHAVGANVAGQIGSVIAGGMIINLVEELL